MQGSAFSPQLIAFCCLMMLVCHDLVYSQSSDFYRTYGFRKFEATVLSPYEMIHVNQENAEFVRSHIRDQLEAQGMAFSTAPEVFVDIFVHLKLEKQNTGGYSGSFESGGYGKSGFSIYEVGTLSVRLSDAANNKLLWENSRTIPLWKKKEKKIRNRVDNLVSKLFKDFNSSILVAR